MSSTEFPMHATFGINSFVGEAVKSDLKGLGVSDRPDAHTA